MTVSTQKTIIIIGACFLALFAYVYFWMNQTVYLTQIAESVTGLRTGARVEFNGVEVGSVKRIRIDKAHAKFVDVYLQIEHGTPITSATTAALSTNDAEPGKPFIALHDDGNITTALIKKAGESYPVIPAILSAHSETKSSLNSIAQNVKEFNQTIQTFLTKDDIESFRQLLYSLQTVVGMLAENNQHLQRIIINTDTISTKLNATFQTLQANTLPATNRLINNMNQLIGQVDELTAEIKQNPSMLIRGKALPKPGPGE